jgi:hypothetical protein
MLKSNNAVTGNVAWLVERHPARAHWGIENSLHHIGIPVMQANFFAAILMRRPFLSFPAYLTKKMT